MFGDDVLLTRPVNSEPFVEQYTHTLTGVTGIIELNMDYDWSACSIPASWNYNTPTNSNSSGFGSLQFIESLDQNGVFVSLLNDLESPGNSYYYGTDGTGIKGWYAIVDNIGLTCETLPDCATIISIVDDIEALQTDVALKANTADLGATAFSNSYNDLDNLPTIPAAQVNSDWNATSGVAQILNKPTLTNGTVTAVTATSPISSTGGATPNLSMSSANGTTNGYLLLSDWLIFNGKFNTPSGTTLQYLRGDGSLATFPTITSGTVTSVAALTLGTTGADLSSTVANGTTTPVITLNVPTASAANRGALSSADWSTFNSKQAALGFTAENAANKQNSLAVDGTGAKFPTVDAVNSLSMIDRGKRMVSFFTDFISSVALDGGTAAGAGSSTIISGSGIPNRTNQQGVIAFQTLTAAFNYVTYYGSSGVQQLWFGGGAWNFETLINISALSTLLERYRLIFGFGSGITNAAETDGVFITYDEGGTANGTAASANWQCVTVANSVRTLTTTTTAVTAAAWNKLRIEVNAAGTSVTFYVNGTAIATHTTNIPLPSIGSRYFNMKMQIAKQIGTTSRALYCDYVGYENILTTPRT
jgi:hypothetical protein